MDKVIIQAKTLAKQYRSVIQLMETLEEIDSLEKSYKEAKGYYNKTKILVADVKKEYDQAIFNLKIKYKKIEEAEEKAVDIVKIARDKAATLTAEAATKAKEWVEIAEDKVKKAEEDMINQARDWRVDNDLLMEERDILKEEISNLKSEFNSLRSRLEM